MRCGADASDGHGRPGRKHWRSDIPIKGIEPLKPKNNMLVLRLESFFPCSGTGISACRRAGVVFWGRSVALKEVATATTYGRLEMVAFFEYVGLDFHHTSLLVKPNWSGRNHALAQMICMSCFMITSVRIYSPYRRIFSNLYFPIGNVK